MVQQEAKMNTRAKKTFKRVGIATGALLAVPIIWGTVVNAHSSSDAPVSAPMPTYSPQPVNTPSTTGPDLQLSCTLGYTIAYYSPDSETQSNGTFYSENITGWWAERNAVGFGNYSYSTFEGTISALVGAWRNPPQGSVGEYFAGPFSTQQQAQDESWQSYLTTQPSAAVQVQVINTNSVAVPIGGVNVSFFDTYGDELGSSEVGVSVVSIAPGVTLTSYSSESLGVGSTGLWIPGTTCQTTTYSPF